MSNQLSPREREVLGCLAEGLPNKTIADRLGVADSTVKIYVKAILRKKGFSNRTQAAIWVKDAEIGRLREGLIEIQQLTYQAPTEPPDQEASTIHKIAMRGLQEPVGEEEGS